MKVSRLLPGIPRVTVLIVTWNAWSHLAACLRSIAASAYRDLAVLVIDNASADQTAENLARTFPDVELIRNSDNVGHTRAVNQGFRAARGEIILLLDADAELAPDALGKMMDFLDAHADVALVAPRTYNTDGSVQESARSFPSAINGLFGRQSLLTRLFPNNRISANYLQRDRLSTSEPYPVDSVASSCMLLRRSLVDRLGDWDEGFPGYFVDTDWCFRLRQAGVRVFCVPEAGVVHHEQNSRTRKRSARRIWMFHMGALRFYRKNRSFGWCDPRTVAAAALLSLRAGLLIVSNALKRVPAPLPTVPPRAGGEQAGSRQ